MKNNTVNIDVINIADGLNLMLFLLLPTYFTVCIVLCVIYLHIVNHTVTFSSHETVVQCLCTQNNNTTM